LESFNLLFNDAIKEFIKWELFYSTYNFA
jgi:hypothetical protein